MFSLFILLVLVLFYQINSEQLFGGKWLTGNLMLFEDLQLCSHQRHNQAGRLTFSEMLRAPVAQNCDKFFLVRAKLSLAGSVQVL